MRKDEKPSSGKGLAAPASARDDRETTVSDAIRSHLVTPGLGRGPMSVFAGVFGSPVTKAHHVRRILAASGVKPSDAVFVGDGWTDLKTARPHA